MGQALLLGSMAGCVPCGEGSTSGSREGRIPGVQEQGVGVLPRPASCPCPPQLLVLQQQQEPCHVRAPAALQEQCRVAAGADAAGAGQLWCPS